MKLFFDTSVLIDYFAQKGSFGAAAHQLAIVRFFDDARLWASANSFTDTFLVLKKYKNPQQLQQVILHSLAIFDICSLERDDIEAACKLGWLDFEDALIAVCAGKVGADYLVTRDIDLIARCSRARIPARTPEQIIELFKERGLTYAPLNLDALDLDS